MEFAAIKEFAQFLSAALAVGAAVYAVFAARSKANASEIQALKEQMQAQRTDLAVLREQVSGLERRFADGSAQAEKTYEEVGAVHVRVNSVSKTVNNVMGQLTQINQTLQTIQGSLMRKDREK